MEEKKYRTDDLLILEDKNNPISQTIQQMGLIKNFTRLSGLQDLMEITYFRGPGSFFEYYRSPMRVFTNMGMPKEIFYILGIETTFIEQLSVIAAISPKNREIIAKARSLVPSSTYCTYHQAALGAIESQYFPLPDLFVAPSYICEEGVNLLTYLAKKYDKPILYIDFPYEKSEEAELYLAKQLENLAKDLADFFHLTLKTENIENAFRWANEARDWWMKYVDLCAYDGEDMNMAYQNINLGLLINNKFGLEEYSRLTKKCYEEMLEKIQGNKNESPSNKLRILWLHLMPYHSSALVGLLKNLKINIVTTQVSQIRWKPLDPRQPWRSLARKFMDSYVCSCFTEKMEELDDLITRFKIDAVIELCHPGCKPLCSVSFLIKSYLKEKGMPHLSFEADLINPENISIEQIRTRLEAFIEILNAQK